MLLPYMIFRSWARWDAIFYEITPILPAISTVIILASLVVLTPLLLVRRKAW